jgi:hypothetical protein
LTYVDSPFSYSLSHFGTILKAAERILGPYEYEGISLQNGNDDLNNFSIPFAAIRPFLQNQSATTSNIKNEKNQLQKPQEANEKDIIEDVGGGEIIKKSTAKNSNIKKNDVLLDLTISWQEDDYGEYEF